MKVFMYAWLVQVQMPENRRKQIPLLAQQFIFIKRFELIIYNYVQAIYCRFTITVSPYEHIYDEASKPIDKIF